MAPQPTPPAAKAKPGNILKRIPPWGWAIGAGAVLGIGYTLYKGRREPEVLDAPVGEEALAGEYDLATQPSPGGAYYPSTPIIAEPAETVGAVGQTALETVIMGMTGVFESLPGLIEASRPELPEVPEPPDINITMPSAPAPAPAPIPRTPTPTPRPRGVTILGRNFPNALRYKQLPRPGRGKLFAVDYPNRTEIWETWIPRSGGARKWARRSTRYRKNI